MNPHVDERAGCVAGGDGDAGANDGGDRLQSPSYVCGCDCGCDGADAQLHGPEGVKTREPGPSWRMGFAPKANVAEF